MGKGGRGETGRTSFITAVNRYRQGHVLEQEHVIALLSAGPHESEELFVLADEVRRHYVGDQVHLRGIIEFSNYCSRQCHYCGLRFGNQKVRRYRLSAADIIITAFNARRAGFQTVVLQSGEDSFYSADRLVYIIRRIKKETAMAVTISVGERSCRDYQKMREAGADRYLIKQETSDPALFARLRPLTTLQGRLQCLKWLKELGYETGSGNMVGLPGQTLVTLARDLELMRELDVDMAGIGPFLPHPDTPLAQKPAGTAEMALKVLAVARLMMPDINLPATTAIETLHPQGRKLALQCGANVIMPNITPQACREHYSIYPHKAGGEGEIGEIIFAVKRLIYELGRDVGRGYGNREKIF